MYYLIIATCVNEGLSGLVNFSHEPFWLYYVTSVFMSSPNIKDFNILRKMRS